MRMVPDNEEGTLRIRTIPDDEAVFSNISDMDWHEFTMKHLAPGIGCIIATIMFLSPFKAIQQVRRQKHLGDFNPLPLVSIIANCISWLVYGSITQDPYVILANEPGLMMGLYMTITAYGYADAKPRSWYALMKDMTAGKLLPEVQMLSVTALVRTADEACVRAGRMFATSYHMSLLRHVEDAVRARDAMLRALLFFGGAISVCSISIALFIPELAGRELAAGYQAVGVLLCYYAAPLSVLADVFRTRSSTSLYWPLAFMSCINGSLWVAYGLAKGDPFIWAPNAVGTFFGVLQLLLICVFPSKPGVHSARRVSATGSEEDALLRPQSSNGADM